MNIEVFQEFAELARRLNFNETARELHMSQSALSKHIQALELEYGAPLFRRDKNHVELTAEGTTLIEYAQDIWKTYTASVARVREVEQSRPLRAGGLLLNPSEHGAVTRLIAYMETHGAPRKITLVTPANLYADEELFRVASGSLDCTLGFGLSAAATIPESVEVDLLRRVPIGVVAPSGSEFANMDEVPVERLSGSTLIQMTGPYFTPAWRVLNSLLQERGVAFKTKPVGVSWSYEYVGLDLTSGVLLLPKGEFDQVFGAEQGVRWVPINDVEFAFPLEVAYKADRRDPSLRIIIEGLHEVYGA